MIYEHKIRKKAMKFIHKQDRIQQERILRAIYSLPLEGDIKHLTGENGVYRLRVGDYRILFKLSPISNDITIVDITNAGNRGQIYK